MQYDKYTLGAFVLGSVIIAITAVLYVEQAVWVVGLAGAILGALLVFVWSQRHQQKIIAKHRINMEEMQQEKSRLLASASHDLRQPLHAMGLFLDVLLTKTQTEENRYVLEKIVTSQQALDGLLNALMDLAKLDAQVLTAHCKPVHVQNLVRQCYEEYLPKAEAKSLFMVFKGQTDVRVDTDPVLLRRIVSNLLSNAVRYTEQGTIYVFVKVNAGHVHVVVQDSGPGIPEEEIEHIFSEYYQLNASAGLGLGLAIVKRMAVLLEAEVLLESSVGVGSTFSVVLPATKVQPIAKKESPSPVLYDLTGTKILVVDDDRQVLEASCALLHSWGCVTLKAESLEQAIAVLAADTTPPQLMLSDYRLGERMTGIQMAVSLFEHTHIATPVLIVTGDVQVKGTDKLKHIGLTVVHKPVAPAVLRLAIYQALRQKPHA